MTSNCNMGLTRNSDCDRSNTANHVIPVVTLYAAKEGSQDEGNGRGFTVQGKITTLIGFVKSYNVSPGLAETGQSNTMILKYDVLSFSSFDS